MFGGAVLAIPASAQDAAANDPETCGEIWQAIGIPESADDSGDTLIPVCHLGYIAGHDSETKTPDWVVEHLTRAIAQGTNTRPGTKFSEEINLPANTPRAFDADYTATGYDRGHQAPSNDFKSSSALMEDTFFLSNAVPQVGLGFNRGIWKDLEALVVKLAIDRGELYVITGPVNQQKKPIRIKPGSDACGASLKFDKPDDKVIKNDVAVPAALYKIIYDPALGRLNAYLLPNVDHRDLQDTDRDLEYLKRYRVGLGTLEKLTGLTFMSALDDRDRRMLKEECPATMLR
jgi:endonuclease G